MLQVKVKPWQGSPTLFINGEPHDGLMHWHRFPERRPEDVEALGKAGIHLHSFPTELCLAPGAPEDHTGIVAPAGDDRTAIPTLDLAGLDRVLACILNADPEALVMPRLKLNPDAAWRAQHPQELMRHWLIDSGRMETGTWAAVTSEAWDQAWQLALSTIIEHLESHWGEHLLGYHTGMGDCAEHAYQWGWPERMLSDYSAPQQAAFRVWLGQRYLTTEALRLAWDDPQVTLGTADVPEPTRRLRRDRAHATLLEPQRDSALIDYQRFASEAMAAAVLRQAQVVKGTLRALGREKIYGAFYAYHFVGLNEVQGLLNTGHHAQDRVLASPDIDFICAPLHYRCRQLGGRVLPQLSPASLGAHGKLYYAEDDTGTHLAKPDWFGYRPKDVDQAASALRRNFLGTWQDGGSLWWMDWEGKGWYQDPALLTELAALRSFAQRTLKSSRTLPSQVAVFTSDTGLAHLHFDSDLYNSLVERQLDELSALGAPFDLLRIEDLPRLEGEGGLAAYRLCIFLDTFELQPSWVALIKARLACAGRTLLWCHGPGLVSGDAWDAAAASARVGMTLRLHPERRTSLMVESWLTGSRLAYGSERPVYPCLIGDDPQARVHGYLVDAKLTEPSQPGLEDQGLLEKDLGGWKSIWSAAPGIPSQLLQHFAREAGVHLYAERGDQVYVGPGWLGVHARLDGEMVIALPQPSEIREARTGALQGSNCQQIRCKARRGDTLLWSLAPSR
ncbi:MAG: hypothetical protein J0L75_04895 [Spirochaetes bacterium]|nr:hypothetical protein [Spirochaetota bacterium]